MTHKTYFNPQPKIIPVRLSPHARRKLKRHLYLVRAGGRCESCGRPVKWSDGGKWDKFSCAHLSHIKSEGSGGDTTPENCKIECFNCHNNIKHGPRWRMI